MSSEHNNEKESGWFKDTTDDYSLDAYKAAATTNQSRTPYDVPHTTPEKLGTICIMLAAFVTFPLWFPVAVVMIATNGCCGCCGTCVDRKYKETGETTVYSCNPNDMICNAEINTSIERNRTIDPTISDPDDGLIAGAKERLQHQKDEMIANITAKIKKDNADPDDDIVPVQLPSIKETNIYFDKLDEVLELH